MIRPIFEAEVRRLKSKASIYGPETVWEQNEFSEILPFPKPLSLSFLRGLASHNGATGMVCRELGLPYNSGVPAEDYLETLFGRLYVNKIAEKHLNSGPSKRSFLKTFSASARLERENRNFYLEFPAILESLESYYIEQNRTDVRSLSDPALDKMITELNSRLNDHYCYVVKSGLLAGLNLENITSFSGKGLAPDLISVDVEALTKNNKDAGLILDFRKKEISKFWMFSASVEYELACPRFSETGVSQLQTVSLKSEKTRPIPRGRKLRDSLLFFRVYESLKVIYKTLLLREIHLLRIALVEAGIRSEYGKDIFYLTFDEVTSVLKNKFRQVINERKEKERVFQTLDLPVIISPSDLDNRLTGTAKHEPHRLKGLSVSGCEFEGKALIFRNDSDLDKADFNTVIVSRYASPNLVMAFAKARGIIAETGGLLSHLAIVAREQGFPLILQAQDSTALINDGNTVTVDKNGNIFLKE